MHVVTQETRVVLALRRIEKMINVQVEPEDVITVVMY